jgi:sulfur-oxidizing protein SoxY
MRNSVRNSTEIRAPSRRRTLLGLLASFIAAPCAFAFALMPRPQAAFRATKPSDTMRELYGESTVEPSDRIRISAADLAENGAVVPIKVEADFNNVRAITIIATKNPVPLVAKFSFAKTATAFVATRIKLAESCDVIAVVETDTGYYQASRAIAVTVGGCGVG